MRDNIHVSLEQPCMALEPLLNHEPRELPDIHADRRILIWSSSPTHAILGFAIRANARPTARWRLTFNGRPYQLSVEPVLIPLKPSEVRLGATYTLIISGDGPVTLYHLDVYLLPVEKLELPPDEEPTPPPQRLALLDYRAPQTQGESKVHQLFQKAVSIITALPFDDLFVTVVKAIYRSEFGEYFREIAAKAAAADQEKALPVWGQALREVIEEDQVRESARADLWRDVALLPEEARGDLPALLWQKAGDARSVDAAVCAFLA
jgi:hypothetical protein